MCALLWLSVVLTVATGVGANFANLSLSIEPQSIVVTFGENVTFTVEANGYTPVPIEVKFYRPEEICSNQTISYAEGWHNGSTSILFQPSKQGRFIVKPLVEPAQIVDDRRFFALIKVAMHQPLIIVSLLIGWTYTACWSTGYYPQIWLNYRRKSVVGLSFDFLYINIVGHVCYAVFNAFLYWNSHVENEYYRRHPFGLNPVIGNDIGFAMHAVFGTGFTILQCRMYDTGGNSVSTPAKAIISVYMMIITITFSAAALRLMHWLDFLYIMSYIKLSTTMIKYFPQAYMNYRRQSTEGFEILNRLLDLAGGLFGILQMVINAWNFGKFPETTLLSISQAHLTRVCVKSFQMIGGQSVVIRSSLGWAFFSILFDLVFMFQHYILYR
ncbi:AGAP001628-PA-like protein [Anopheles sinensis]|uniref:Cystinosin homolog n=1 Tax=Anopheles sinensis TaxID=74873 RepID=A0A084VWJ7_ANOSI|nr:AGAP001628-PA-like protein [Anopheles sinensis]